MSVAGSSRLSGRDPAGDRQPWHHEAFCFEEAEMRMNSGGAACAAEHWGCKDHSVPPKS